MNKKIFGIKISTILTALACLIVSLFIWITVKYNLSTEEVAALLSSPMRLI